jgi:hypothetical protein
MLPFQAYVLAAFLAQTIYQIVVVHRRYSEPSFYLALYTGYTLAFVVLVSGGFRQRSLGDKRGSAFSWLIAALCVVFVRSCPSPFAI